MTDLSSIQKLIDVAPDVVAEYEEVVTRLAEQNQLRHLGGSDLSASEIEMLDTWITNNNSYLQDNFEYYEKCKKFSSLTDEQIQDIKKECEELCQTPSEEQP
jgi:hypothetical protein